MDIVVLTLTLKTKVFGEQVEELAGLVTHRLVSQTDFVRVRSKNPKLGFLRITPRGELLVELERVVRKWDMVVCVRCRIDVESRGETAVPVEAFALLVTSELRAVWRRVTGAGKALELLFVVATGAVNKHLYLTGSSLVTSYNTHVLACVVAEQLSLSTDLLAAVPSVAALSRTMAKLPTRVESAGVSIYNPLHTQNHNLPALKPLSANLTAMSLLEMTRLVVESSLPTSADLFRKTDDRKRAVAGTWTYSTAGEFHKVVEAEEPSGRSYSLLDLNTDMLSFDWKGVNAAALLLLLGDSLGRLLFTYAAMLSTSVSSTVPGCLAHFEAQGVLDVSLVAECLSRNSAATTIDIHDLRAWGTVANVTQRLAQMATLQLLLADSLAVGNTFLTRLARVVHEIFEGCLATRTRWVPQSYALPQAASQLKEPWNQVSFTGSCRRRLDGRSGDIRDLRMRADRHTAPGSSNRCNNRYLCSFSGVCACHSSRVREGSTHRREDRALGGTGEGTGENKSTLA
ncbi:hypothetical protein NM208_g16230 [Fusarium decemcellulare]|uniref:Uncharacterized protein n=1 Tax=Fusarium decemcellulare TaxID=57161 RepID=A0ACC1RE73_9HYPO|nr:hypothetical protein NM208_g16230 [Fusarium decemcellulare]